MSEASQTPVTPSTARYVHPPTNCIAFTRIMVRDLDRSQAFYASVFGWRFMEPQPNIPRIFFTGGEVMGGLHLLAVSPSPDASSGAGEDVRPRVVNYIMVADVDETLRKVVENGGTVTKDKFTEGNHTELAEFEFDGVVHGVLKWLMS